MDKYSNIDYLGFTIKTQNLKIDNLCDSLIEECAIMEVFTPEFAAHLSNIPVDAITKRILVMGCGAIGSKLIYHLYRMGITKLTICDNDIMHYHNLCRHALTTPNGSKVDSIKESLKQIYLGESSNILCVNEDLHDWLPEQDLNQYDLIIDATASASVLKLLDRLSPNFCTPILHFALSDAGNVGLSYINIDRNALLSDYYMHLMQVAIKDVFISNWIYREANYNYDYIRIGEGCHSNTMKLADDIIAIHTGYCSTIIRELFNSKIQNKIYLSFISKEGKLSSNTIDIPNFITLPTNKTDWSVRIPCDLYKQILLHSQSHGRKECGGYLMGVFDYKRRLVYILYTYIPKFIKSSPNRLSLAKEGWIEEYRNVRKKTSDQLIYIGDWHSHPDGTLNMSDIDIGTTEQIKKDEICTNNVICLICNKKSMYAHII